MSFSPSSLSRRSSHRQRAFSLVEVVLAIGVVAFAFVALLGLLPAGMSQFRKAIDTTVATQIAQRIIDDCQQTDFDVLTQSSISQPNLTPVQSYRYFDERGVEVIPQSSAAATNVSALSSTYPAPPQLSEQQQVVYTVSTRVLPLPPAPVSIYAPGQVPQAVQTGQAFQQMATVTVQVMNNPGFINPQLQQGTLLIPPSPSYSILTFSAQIAPNTFSPTYYQ